MACCGKAKPRNPTATRAPHPSPRAFAPAARPAGAEPASALTAAPADQEGTLLEYVGPTRMMVRGPATGRIYRFSKSYAQVLIDDRDVPFLTAVPNLRLPAAPG